MVHQCLNMRFPILKKKYGDKAYHKVSDRQTARVLYKSRTQLLKNVKDVGYCISKTNESC